jgi:transcriptional antiterminator
VLFLPADYDVIKVFNNNVVLANHLGTEKVLIKKGIGFSNKAGDKIPADTEFERIFAIENPEIGSKFNQLINRVDHELIGICEEILHMICEETGEKLDEEIHIRLTDHIAFTVFRIQNDDKIDNPFMVEIETLYEKEVEIAEQAIELLEETLGIRIPHEEAGFIALHIHSLKTKDSLSNTVKYVYICNSAAEVIEDELGIEIDRKSIDYARFASHIRYAVERILKKVEIKNELLPAIRKTYKHSYRLARLVGRMMEQELYASVPDEEIGYLTLHIERLKTQRLKASN